MNRDQSSGRSRPSDEGVGGGGGAVIHFLKWGGGGYSKNIFLGLKISGGGGAGPSPGSATAISLEILYVDLQGV